MGGVEGFVSIATHSVLAKFLRAKSRVPWSLWFLEPQSQIISEGFFFGEHHAPLAGEFVFDTGQHDRTEEVMNRECSEIEYGVGWLKKIKRTRRKTGLLYFDHHPKE